MQIDGEQVFIAETKAMPAGFDKNQFIELLKRQIEVMQKNNEVLLRILDEKITAQEANLDEVQSNQKVLMTMLTVAMTHAADFFSSGSKTKADELKRKMMRDIAAAQEKTS